MWRRVGCSHWGKLRCVGEDWGLGFRKGLNKRAPASESRESQSVWMCKSKHPHKLILSWTWGSQGGWRAPRMLQLFWPIDGGVVAHLDSASAITPFNIPERLISLSVLAVRDNRDHRSFPWSNVSQKRGLEPLFQSSLLVKPPSLEKWEFFEASALRERSTCGGTASHDHQGAGSDPEINLLMTLVRLPFPVVLCVIKFQISSFKIFATRGTKMKESHKVPFCWRASTYK